MLRKLLITMTTFLVVISGALCSGKSVSAGEQREQGDIRTIYVTTDGTTITKEKKVPAQITVVDKKDGDYTLKKVEVTDTYIEVKMELPFQPSLGNPHDNFIIVYDDKGRALEMSTGSDGKNKMYTQINELIDIGEIPLYIDILVCTNYGEEANPLSSFRVDLK